MSEEKPVTVYISIGNSDDKLPQAEWALYVQEVRAVVNAWAPEVHGAWFSAPDSTWQNACWCAEFNVEHLDAIRHALADIREKYQQDSVAWAVARTEFL